VNLGGEVHGQPVVADGRIVAATERNRIVSLDPRSGAVQWSRTLGAPLTNVTTVAGCGNIDPLGVTSTPAIDPTTHTVYVVSEVASGTGGARHVLTGLDIQSGRTVLSEDVDPPLPPREKAVNLLQRVGLAVERARLHGLRR
jgi:outer membrane protein assembly factor BamB